MKRILIAAGVLISAAVTFSGIHQSNERLSDTLKLHQTARSSQMRDLEELRTQLVHFQSRCQQLKLSVKDQQRLAGISGELDGVEPGTSQLSAGQAEKLLAELGFNWRSTGDYVVVSKSSLYSVLGPGVRGFKLSDTACQVLAIAPEQRVAIESALDGIGRDYQERLRSRIKREEPSGDILAKYSFENDPAFTQSLSNRLTSAIVDGLGDQRAGLLLHYSHDWMVRIGMRGSWMPEKGTTMIIRRQPRQGPEQQNYLMLDLNQSGGRMSCGITPGQPVPEAFQPLFPGGWEELARREGFELPPSFRDE